MVAQTLTRTKKQSRQIEKANKLLAQIPAQLKDLEKKQSKQISQIGRQLTQLQSQLKQLQKRFSRIKAAAAVADRKRERRRPKSARGNSSYTTVTLNL
jgi:septal ring factor EnvC (AmiA/AmiB activator)